MLTLLDNSVLIIGVVYISIRLARYYFTQYSVLETQIVHDAYFNIMWAKKRRDLF